MIRTKGSNVVHINEVVEWMATTRHSEKVDENGDVVAPARKISIELNKSDNGKDPSGYRHYPACYRADAWNDGKRKTKKKMKNPSWDEQVADGKVRMRVTGGYVTSRGYKSNWAYIPLDAIQRVHYNADGSGVQEYKVVHG